MNAVSEGVHLSGIDKKMRNWLVQSIAPFATVAMILGSAAFSGCEKKPEVYTARGNDPVYQKALQESHANQNKISRVREKIASQMEELVSRARAVLPADATDDQVRQELESNPAKYPGWKALSSALAKANADLEKQMGNARATVRARILKEAADRKAVAEGRAVEKASTTAK